jgi:hypothetical protein
MERGMAELMRGTAGCGDCSAGEDEDEDEDEQTQGEPALHENESRTAMLGN